MAFAAGPYLIFPTRSAFSYPWAIPARQPLGASGWRPRCRFHRRAPLNDARKGTAERPSSNLLIIQGPKGSGAEKLIACATGETHSFASLARACHRLQETGETHRLYRQPPRAKVVGSRGESHRCDCLPMVLQKREPSFRGFWISRSASHPTGNRSLSETSNPSIRSSPWIPGAPQVPFSATIRNIRLRTSF